MFQDNADLEKEKQSLEKWVDELKQPPLPYVILVGDIRNVIQSYVVFKGEYYPYLCPMKAVEACYKCLMALKQLPTACEHIWGILKKLVYGMPSDLMNHGITKFVCDVRKFNLSH